MLVNSSPRNTLIVLFRKTLQIRVSEIANMDVNDVDQENRGIIVRRKNDKIRYCYLSDEQYLVLNDYLKILPVDQIPLFVNNKGLRLKTNTIMGIIKQTDMEENNTSSLLKNLKISKSGKNQKLTDLLKKFEGPRIPFSYDSLKAFLSHKD